MADSSNNSFRRSLTIEEDDFGSIKIDGKDVPIRRFTLSNSHGFIVQVINYGATITKIVCPDKNSQPKDVVLGFDNIEGYLTKSNPYFGATVGRVCNRIRNGEFSIGNKKYQVTKNRNPHHLHGGKKGFDKVVWEAVVDDGQVVFSYLSKDGEEGYPGAVLVSVTYMIGSDENTLKVKMQATSTKTTPINITNHSYFNLGGYDSGDVYRHVIKLNADRYTVYDQDSIPTGVIASVDGTPYDLRTICRLGQPIHSLGGLDQNFCVNVSKDREQNNLVAKVLNPDSGISLFVHSNQVGVQVYTSNYFPSPDQTVAPEMEIIGKGGVKHYQHHAFCLETQAYPDSVNHANFPSTLIKPGDIYKHSVSYYFGTRSDFLQGEDTNDLLY